MYKLFLTDGFQEWLDNIRDGMAKRRLVRRLERVQNGNLGDVKSVGENVWEMREHFGAGYRMYYLKQGDILIIMLAGGDKSSQQRDIEQAIELSKTLDLEDETND